MTPTHWITLYDVSRDGIGIIPWLFAIFWIAGIIAVPLAVRKRSNRRGALSIWLALWVLLGGFGLGNVFYQYFANIHALKTGACQMVEGPIAGFHPQDHRRKGDSEQFVVGGQAFLYSSSNLAGGGLRSSAGFSIPLRDGLYVKIWHRKGVICRLEAAE